MTKKKLTSEEKIEKAKKHLEELHALKLTPEEMEKVAGGTELVGTPIVLDMLVIDEKLEAEAAKLLPIAEKANYERVKKGDKARW